MGNLRSLEARLARLEARILAIPDPEEQKAREQVTLAHHETWLLGGSFEDVMEKDRDPALWDFVLKYGPVHLEMVWKGLLDGREELLAAGVDFARLAGIDEDEVAAARASGATGPEVASEASGDLPLSEEDR